MADAVDVPSLKTRAYLIMKGLPYDVVMGLGHDEAEAWIVAFGEANGGEWDHLRGRWKEDGERSSQLHGLTVMLDGARISDAFRKTLDARGPTDGVGRASFER